MRYVVILLRMNAHETYAHYDCNKRIPDNWYRRYDDHSIAAFFVDAVYAGAKHPELLSIGGNVGKALK